MTDYNGMDDDLLGKVRGCFEFVDKNASIEAADLVVAFVASLVHPDHICNLHQLGALPAVGKAAVHDALSRFLNEGLSPAESTAIYAAVLPRLMPRLFPKW